jgi:nucleoside-diphosphate-sugar epimerase
MVSLKGRKVFVTGGSGFIGTRLAEMLSRDHGAVVTAGVRSDRAPDVLSALGVQVRRARLGDRRELEAALRDQDIVFNLAYDFRQSAKSNVRGFENLVGSCVALGSKRLVHVSTIAVYDDWPEGDLDENSPSERPGSEYKNAKMEMERILVECSQRNGVEAVILQPTIVYGPRSRFWTDMIVERLLSGTVVLPGRADGQCNAVYVDDVAQALILSAMKRPAEGERFIISGNEPVLWRNFFESYAAILGTESIRYVEPADRGQSCCELSAGAATPSITLIPARSRCTFAAAGAVSNGRRPS